VTTQLQLSLVIVTYNRDQILTDSVSQLLEQTGECEGFREFLIVDQTREHEPETEHRLGQWHEQGLIHWIRLPEPDLTGAMNVGLTQSSGDLVLYVDDDIIPKADLLKNHIRVHKEKPEVTAVVGQILQPGEEPEDLPYETHSNNPLKRYMDFPFRSMQGCYIENAMAGNLCVKRREAIEAGGFDENFRPPVASRFETEFAKRLVRQGRKIWFEPSASIHHLAAKSGGTRTSGYFLRSASPVYTVGDYYMALLVGRGLAKFTYILVRPFRQIRTRFHLRHPWWIPAKLISEFRGFCLAIKLKKQGQKLLPVQGAEN
jgi:GT2 family glycosyltransferase